MPYFFHKIPKTIEKLVRQEIGCCRAVVKTNTNRAIFIIMEAFRNNTNRYKNERNRLYRCRSLWLLRFWKYRTFAIFIRTFAIRKGPEAIATLQWKIRNVVYGKCLPAGYPVFIPEILWIWYLQMMENDGVTGRLPPKVYDEVAKYHCTKQSVWV